GILGLGPDRLRRFLRDHAKLGQRVRRMRLDLEPDLETRLCLPDGGHFRAGIAGDHRRLWRSRVTPRFSRRLEVRQTSVMPGLGPASTSWGGERKTWMAGTSPAMTAERAAAHRIVNDRY